MCKHYWKLGFTSLEGTPAVCKFCGEERVFLAKTFWDTATERRQPRIQPSRVTVELPFNSHGGFGNMSGNRL